MNLVPLLLAFAGGCLVSVINAALTKRAFDKKKDTFGKFFAFRQVLNVAYLIVIYLLGQNSPENITNLLLGAAIGLTIPSIILSTRMSKQYAKEQKPSSGGKKGA